MALGKIKKLVHDKGFGFIQTESGQDIFFHHSTVANQGFALDLEECEPGLCCAAAPVFDENGRVVASLSVSGPAARLTEDRLHREVIPVVVDQAEWLSRQLGHAA